MDLLAELRLLIVRHAGGASQHRATVLDGVSISSVTEPTPPAAAMSEPSLAVVAQGVKRTVLTACRTTTAPASTLWCRWTCRSSARHLQASADEPFAVFSMKLKPAAIAPLLLETVQAARPPAFSGLAISDATPELLDPVVRLLRLLEHPDDLRVLAPGLEREILWRLITGDQGALVRQIGLASSSLAHISRAIRWIREHYHEPVLVADLAALSGMSASSFHRHFRAATSMTPIQFAKQIRLQEARALLMTHRPTSPKSAISSATRAHSSSAASTAGRRRSPGPRRRAADRNRVTIAG